MLTFVLAAALSVTLSRAEQAEIRTFLAHMPSCVDHPGTIPRYAAHPIGELDGRHVVVLEYLTNPCGDCGAAACPFHILQLNAHVATEIGQVFGTTLRTIPARPLDTLIVVDHVSAYVSNEERWVWRRGVYHEASSNRLRFDGTRAPWLVTVRFRAGTSAALLRGRLGMNWGDDYRVYARRGQRVAVSHVRSGTPLDVAIVRADDTSSDSFAFLYPTHYPFGRAPYIIPRSGAYDVRVGPAMFIGSELPPKPMYPYSLELSIR
ncbi:MAG TPA: hypothetical protein VMD91_06355 [Candidatus Sulfotelmatobacter sp.]|nr:hypothetical protein [Candidatus Sulfotelmatobacter sp.]